MQQEQNIKKKTVKDKSSNYAVLHRKNKEHSKEGILKNANFLFECLYTEGQAQLIGK